MKRYIKTSTGATDIVRDLYHRMPNELDFINEQNRSDGMIDLVFEVTSRFKHEAESICKSLVGEGLDARMGRNNRIIITAPEDEDIESCDRITASVDWGYYGRFEDIMDKYLPASGEGDTLATQIVTALTKLIYKWYNDGDVYDNTYHLQGWANDLSSYANWLYAHVKQKWLLSGIADAVSESDYEDLLQEMANTWLDPRYLEEMANKPKDGSIYHAGGPFKFVEYDEEDDDWETAEFDDDEEDYDE